MKTRKIVAIPLLACFFAIFHLIQCFPSGQGDSDHKPRKTKSNAQKVILILADGVRYDYVRDPNLVSLHKMAEQGVRAEYVVPIFPSNSYPNWYTIVTGRYAESHGMVQNFMFDPEKKDTFLMAPHQNASNPHWWEMAEPLWVTAEKQGVKTAVYWWDGCQVTIKNTTATSCQEYQSFWSWPNFINDTMEAINEILDNFENDEWGLALIYYEAVDATGHAWGSESEERVEAMKELDRLMGFLKGEIETRNLTESVNTILVSDHGMLTVDAENSNKTKIIEIESILDENDVVVMLDRGGMSMLIPVPGKESKVLNDLNKAKPEGLRFYDKPNIPTEYHFKNNQRVAPILLVAEKGYFLRGFTSYGKTKPIADVIYPGHHGYDPYDVKEMRTIMYASGPGLKKNFVSKPLMMTDHYNLICNLLNIEAQPNNGSWLRVQDMLEDRSQNVANFFSCSRGHQLHKSQSAFHISLFLIFTSVIYAILL